MRRFFRLGFALLFASVGACTLAVDAEKLAEGCPEGEKLCDGRCVPTNDPETGCARPNSCQPCALPRAVALCDAKGECGVFTCNGSYENCNGDPSDGCEVDTNSSTEHCGSCTAPPCQLDNADPDCASGECAILRCRTGYRDCNGRDDDGCEIHVVTDELHCGDCMTRCDAGQSCISGVCED